ncbi:MAG: hypothetical protein HY741_18510 [Chloroflexi bacterium]|nr:hypothetical protein [Chloroflexota bacterium]
MSLKSAAILALRIIALTIVYLICFIIASAVTIAPLTSQLSAPEDANTAAQYLPLVALLNTLVLSFIILRARWSGWRLTATVFFIFYGVNTFMSQIETAAFPPVANRLPPGMLPGLFVMGIIQAALFAPIAVFILGKWKKDAAADESNDRLVMPVGEWVWKLAAIALAYVLLYFTFGYYVAWRNPAVQQYYGGTDPGSFLAQIANVMRDTPWLPFFQILRGLLWALIALPVIRMLKGAWWQAALAVGLLFAVIMNSALLLPNPLMPEAVRLTHLVETATSNFIFGVIVVWLLHRRHRSLRELLDMAAPTRPLTVPKG